MRERAGKSDGADDRARPAAPGSLVIGIPTYRRPADLARLLTELPATIARAIEENPVLQIEILVVDNDCAESAREVARQHGVRYVSEATPGVTAVRNRLLDETEHADLLVFIDDDETPADAGWLASLLRTRAQSSAAAVAGPVRTVIDAGELDPWVAAGGFFARAHRTHLTSGAPISRAATNNLMIDLAAVRQASLRFDERFGKSGGEDSLFTSQFSRSGARMVWCAEAVVLDHLLPARQTRRHALDRTRGMASAGVRVGLVLAESRAHRIRVRGRALGVGAVRASLGALRVARGWVMSSLQDDAVGRREIARGLGSFGGAFGRSSEQYGRPPVATMGERKEAA